MPSGKSAAVHLPTSTEPVDNRLGGRIDVRGSTRHPARPLAAAGVGQVKDLPSGAGARPEEQPGAAVRWVAARTPPQQFLTVGWATGMSGSSQQPWGLIGGCDGALEITDEAAGPSKVRSTDDYAELEVLASAATKVKAREKRREDNLLRAHKAQNVSASFRTEPWQSATTLVSGDRTPQGWRAGGTGNARAVTAGGMQIPDGGAFAQQFLDALRTYPAGPHADGQEVKVATLRVDRSPARTLRSTDSAEATTASLTAAAEAHETALRESLAAPADSPKAITACTGQVRGSFSGGGLCRMDRRSAAHSCAAETPMADMTAISWIGAVEVRTHCSGAIEVARLAISQRSSSARKPASGSKRPSQGKAAAVWEPFRSKRRDSVAPAFRCTSASE